MGPTQTGTPNPAYPGPRFTTFVALWATQGVSFIASAMSFFALLIWMTQTYSDPAHKAQLSMGLAAINIAATLPGIVLMPLAGVWVDRYSRKSIMILMDFAQALVSAVILLLMLTDSVSVWSVVLLLIPMSAFHSIHSLALDTSYILLVPKQLLPRANGMMQTVWTLTTVVSPPLAVGIMSLPDLLGNTLGWNTTWLRGLESGIPLIIAFDVLTCVIAAGVLTVLRIPSTQPERIAEKTGQAEKNFWREFSQGWSFLFRRPAFLLLVTIGFFTNLVLGIEVLLPIFVKVDLAADLAFRSLSFEAGYAMFDTVGGLGGILGGLLVSTWGGLKSKRVLGVLIPWLLMAVTLIVLGMSPWLYLGIAMYFLRMALVIIGSSHSRSIWQSQVPPEIQGRVFSVTRLVSRCSGPLGITIAGILGGVIPPGQLFVGGGLLLLMVVAGALLYRPLLRIEEQECVAVSAP